MPSRSRAAVREASSRGTELKTRQPDGVFPPVERRKAVNVRLSKSHLPKSSPGKAEAASSNAAQSKAEQSKTLEEIRRRSKAVGAATSTTRGKEGKGKVRTHGVVLLPSRATFVRRHNTTTSQRQPI